MKFIYCLFILFISASGFAQVPELMVPAGHGDQVYIAKFSADGNFLFSVGTGAKGVKIWDTKTGRLLKNLIVADFPTSLQSSADTKRLVITTSNEIYIYAFPSFKLLHKTAHGARDAVIGGNTLYVLSESGSGVSKIDLASFKEQSYNDVNTSGEIISLSPNGDALLIVATFSSKILSTGTGNITLTRNQDPGQIVIGYTSSGDIFSFNFSTKKKGDMVSVPAVMSGATLNNLFNFNVKVPGSARLQSLKNQIVYGDNNQVAMAGDGDIILADYTTGKKTREIKTPDADIICMAASGNRLVAGDKYKGTLKEYDINTGNLIRVYGEDAIAPVVWEASSNATGFILDGIFDAPCGYFNSLANGQVKAAAFQKVENELMSIVAISADATINATYNQKLLQLYKAPAFDKPFISFSLPDKQVAALGISPDNKKLIVAYKYYIDVYELASGNLIKEISNDANNYSNSKPKKEEYLNDDQNYCSFSADSRYVAVKADKGVTVFDLETYTAKANPNEDKVEAIRLSNDGKILYYLKGGSYNVGVKWCTMDVINPQPPTETAVNMNLEEVRVSDDDVQKVGASISPDLNLIAYLRNDEIWIYNRKEFVNTAFLKGHQSYVRQVRWLADGILVSSGNDNTIRFWDVEKEIELAKLVLFTNGSWVIVTPDGQFDASEDAMKKLYYVKGIETIPLENLYETFYTPNLLARILQNDALPVPQVDVNALDAPPKITMVFDAARNLVVDNDVKKINWTAATISVTLNAESASSPIDEIRLYLNGKLVDNTNRNLVVEDDNKLTLSKSFTVPLLPGINNFKAIALNKQRTESQPDEADIKYSPPADIPATPINDVTLHLVIIGINNYKNPKYNLNYATADAASFKEALQQNSNSIFSKTKLYFITDEAAMKSKIETTFNTVISEAKPQDIFIFYFAGHGVMTDDQKKKEFYIVPYDVTQLYGADDALAQKGISAAELQEFSKNIPAQKQLFILDACQSAGMINAIAMRGAAEEKAIAQLARSTGSHWLTASGSEQFASEFSQLGHGVFTYCLLQGLKGEAANGDKQITVNELKAYLELMVPEMSQKYKGSPQYPASYGYGNDFPIEVIK